jgi:hypothetical protein
LREGGVGRVRRRVGCGGGVDREQSRHDRQSQPQRRAR